MTSSRPSDQDSTISEALPVQRTPTRIATSVPEARVLTPQEDATHPARKVRSAPTTILQSYSEPEAPSQFRWPLGLIVGFLLVLFVSLLGIGGWYLWQGPVTQTSQSSNSNPEPTAEDRSTRASSQSTPTITPPEAASASTADAVIKQLRERRIGAKPPERVEIISTLEQAETKYPTDYRFPYELSKLSIKGITSHDAAFESLARAAQKAIDNGQADEMLNSLMADKDGDFHKLSHGHHEWEAIEQALRDKDKGVLKARVH